MPPFTIRISPGGRVPIYRQIVEQVQLAISGGQLPAGEPMPSIRSLAERLVVNPNTIAKAYAELAREGFVQARRGRGMFVAARTPQLSPAQAHRRLEAVLETFLDEARSQGMNAEQIRRLVDETLSAQERGEAKR